MGSDKQLNTVTADHNRYEEIIQDLQRQLREQHEDLEKLKRAEDITVHLQEENEQLRHRVGEKVHAIQVLEKRVEELEDLKRRWESENKRLDQRLESSKQRVEELELATDDVTEIFDAGVKIEKQAATIQRLEKVRVAANAVIAVGIDDHWQTTEEGKRLLAEYEAAEKGEEEDRG